MNICGDPTTNICGNFDYNTTYSKSTYNNFCGFGNRIADSKRCELDKAFRMAPRVWDINYGDIRVINHPGFPEGKIMCKTRTTDNHRSLKNYVWEINKRLNLDHTNLIKMIDYSYYSVYKWCAKYWTVNLYFYYHEQSLAKEQMARKSLGRSFTEREIVTILYDLIDVLSSLQQRSISHGDIRPESVFLYKLPTREHVVTKLCDRISNEDPKRAQVQHLFNHRALYMAPELFYNQNTGNVNIVVNPFKADAFSQGLTILELGNLKPFNIQDIYMKGKNQIDFYLIQKLIYEFTLKYPYSVWIGDVLYCLLNADPNVRQNFVELKLNLPERNSVLHYYDKLTILDIKHLEGLRNAHKTVPFDGIDLGIGQQKLYSNLRYKLDPTLDIPKLKFYPFGMSQNPHEDDYHSMYKRPGNMHLDPHNPSFIADLTPPGENFNYNNNQRAHAGGRNSSHMLSSLRQSQYGRHKKSWFDDIQSCGGDPLYDTHHTEQNNFTRNNIDRPLNNERMLGHSRGGLESGYARSMNNFDENASIDWDGRSRGHSPVRGQSHVGNLSPVRGNSPTRAHSAIVGHGPRSEILGHDPNRIENLSSGLKGMKNIVGNQHLKSQFDLDMNDIGIDNQNGIVNHNGIGNSNSRYGIGDQSVRKRDPMSPSKVHFQEDPLHRRLADSRRTNSVDMW